AQRRNAIRAKPIIVGLSQPEHVPLNFQLEVFCRLDAGLEVQVMQVAPREFVDQAVGFVVRWKKILERLRASVVRIAIATGKVVTKAEARLPGEGFDGVSSRAA